MDHWQSVTKKLSEGRHDVRLFRLGLKHNCTNYDTLLADVLEVPSSAAMLPTGLPQFLDPNF